MIVPWAHGLPDGWAIGRGDDGIPLDDRGSVRLVGPPGAAPADELCARLSTALDAARGAADRALVEAAAVGDGERELPTALGGESVWRRVAVAARAAAAATGDPYAVVVLVADEPADAERWLLRAAAALRRSVRDVDVVIRSVDGFTVLAPRCAEAEALAGRLTTALLDAGVGAVASAAAGADPDRCRAEAHARALGADRPIWRL